MLTIVTLLFFTGLFEDLPEATLAAVVIAAVWELVDVRSLAALYRLSTAPFARLSGVVARPDFIAAMATLLGVLTFDTLPVCSSASGVARVDMETVPSTAISAVRMLSELRDDLERNGVRMVLARDVGQVRDLIRRELGEDALRDAYPSVAAAIAALTSQGAAAADGAG